MCGHQAGGHKPTLESVPGASSALSHSVGDSGTVSLTLAPTHPGMSSWMRGERAQESVCVSSHKLLLRTPPGGKRAGQASRGQRPGSTGRRSERAETPKSTYFELAISPVCGLQESLWDTSQGLKLTSSAKASRLLVSMV